jgi:hypothetical protein
VIPRGHGVIDAALRRCKDESDALIRFVGVSSAELSAPDAFAAFAIAFWAGAVVPITGSGLGVVDGVLIAMLHRARRRIR